MTWIAARCLCGILALLMVSTGGPGWAADLSLDLSRQYAFMVSGRPAPGGAAAGPTYILQEQFDGATACGDGSHTNCNNGSWTTLTGTPDYNDTTMTSPFSGNAVKLPNAAIRHDISGTEVYASAIFQSSTTNTTILLLIQDSSGNNLCFSQYKDDNSGKIQLGAPGKTTTDGSSTLSANTTYYLKIYYKKGSGSDGLCTLWTSTTGSSWTQEVALTATTATADAGRVAVRFLATGNGFYDDIRVDDADINY